MNIEPYKDFIKNNIDLIDDDNWEEFFKLAPIGIGNILYNANIDFMTHLMFIPEDAFAHSTDLAHITIPNGVTSIKSRAFNYCLSLKDIIIPDSIVYIGEDAFASCKSLVSITIPEDIITIASNAFHFCSNLSDIHFNGTIERWSQVNLHRYAFKEVPAKTITCKNGVTKLRH